MNIDAISEKKTMKQTQPSKKLTATLYFTFFFFSTLLFYGQNKVNQNIDKNIPLGYKETVYSHLNKIGINAFSFKLKNFLDNNITLFIEGTANDGSYISETKTIKFN